jgi:hypothetical protein
MPYDETYGNIANRLKDWLQASSTGRNVTDVVKDLINRANYWLTLYKPWTNQMKDADLTLVSGKTYSFPSDYAKVGLFGFDIDGDGMYDGYYWRHGSSDDGFVLNDDYTPAAGHSFTITFYINVSQAPRVRYQYVLPDWDGTSTGYFSFYPADLLLRVAQTLRLEDKKANPTEYKNIYNSRNELINMYKKAYLWVVSDMTREVRDYFGRKICLPETDMSGERTTYQNRRRFSNSTDVGGLGGY